ncbi:uncharacterized protein LOC142339899 isoform X2 [Convolutriloba macropyga]|uniref:uncharacterized protein LOC142339899 isoform X2 n=1 Tax=Convolutriloba macropyga TaxID=536237 RepID=UPI003F520425
MCSTIQILRSMGVRVSLFTIVVLMCYVADCEMRGRVRRALKDTARAQMVNMLPDTDGAQNYPLRPYRMTNLTDMLAVEWTCNASIASAEISAKESCACTGELVLEGGEPRFTTCCSQIYNWIDTFKGNVFSPSPLIY